VPDLASDVIGRVKRLPLRPNERGALTPLLEAVSNSIFSVTERFGDATSDRGKIFIDIVRNPSVEDRPVIGFDVRDNGIGFNRANYQSFLTPDSRLKEEKGGKGIGRLAWLKVFNSISVDSIYAEGSKVQHRKFNFRLAEKDQVEIVEEGEVRSDDLKTKISFRDFTFPYAGKFPAKNKTILHRLMSHFVPLFVAGNSPKIILVDGGTDDLESLFVEGVVNERTDQLPFKFGDEDIELTLWSVKCKKSAKFDVGGFNFAFITGNSRSVIDYCIDDQIGLKLLEGEYVYIGCVSGEYLDKHVNSERTAFTLDESEIGEIKRSIAKVARDFLSTYVEAALTQKVKTTQEIVSENPQFLYVMPELKDFAERLQPNAFKKEEIFVELSRDRFRRQKRFESIQSDISKSKVIDTALNEKIEQYKKYVQEEKRGALAEYVIRRKAVIDLFEKFLEYDDADAETYNREDAIHQLICPMRADSHKLKIDDHNLWLIDDRLAFFSYFASDLQMSQYSSVESDERPDLSFFYDTCVAWRQSENTDSVIVVEFKRPMRTEYSKGKDPVQQILGYVKTLKNENAVPDINGRAIRGIKASTAFQCYIVADITPQLEEQIIGRFHKTPDGQGYFGYQTNPEAFVEIVPYGKILNDARLRNTMFFQHLGITNTG
jgi:hypothetical protein